MGVFLTLLLLSALARPGSAQEVNFEGNRRLAKAIVEALQDTRFNEELLFDLKKENEVFLNRTMSLLIKYIVKREVDNYRSRRTDAISRRIYSSLVMKLIDIAKDLPRSSNASGRIDTAHRYYMTVDSSDMHDKMADTQVFHACARLYNIMYTHRINIHGDEHLPNKCPDKSDLINALQLNASKMNSNVNAPRILAQLEPLDDLTPWILIRHLQEMDIKPVHLGVALLVQYHLRSTVNYVIKSKAIAVLSTRPKSVGTQVIQTLKALASRFLPIAELLDIHLAHSSPVFKDTCPATWLGIVNNKNP